MLLDFGWARAAQVARASLFLHLFILVRLRCRTDVIDISTRSLGGKEAEAKPGDVSISKAINVFDVKTRLKL